MPSCPNTSTDLEFNNAMPMVFCGSEKIAPDEECHSVGTIRYYEVLLGTVRYYEVLLGTIRYYWVLLGTVRYYWVLLGTIRYY